MLVLFALIGMTFVLVSSQYRRSSTAAGRAEQYGDDSRKQIDEVFAQLVRDTTNIHSALQQHSLLNDIYGQDGVKGTITASPASVNSQFLNVTIATVTTLAGVSPLSTTTIPTLAQIQTSGYFNGCVATIIDSTTLVHFTTRIVGWDYNNVNPGLYTMRVMAPDGVLQTTFTGITSGTFVINGRPFNGTGFGFNAFGSTPGGINAAQAYSPSLNIPFALLPNGVYFSNPPPTGATIPSTYDQNYTFGGRGGADEEYDAPDPQNMFLAYMPATPTGYIVGPPVGNDIIPSFHRPDLISFMQSSAAYSSNWNASEQRQVFMRPLGQTVGVTTPIHPKFTGSNPGNSTNPGIFDPINGPWDVDNDGDGIADSVWIDFGGEVQTAPDGRRFKPLAAILCLDMDGRLNVNAHGSLAQVDVGFATPGNLLGMTPSTRYTSPQFANPGVTAATPIGLGSGYGPADVSLAPLFTGVASPLTSYQNLLVGDSGMNEGRYGQTSGATSMVSGGTSFVAFPGFFGVQSPLGMLKHFEFPVPGFPNLPTGFGTPPDSWGRGFVGLDVRGTPLMPGIGLTLNASSAIANDTLNNPYELNLSRHVARGTKGTGVGGPDNPFSAGELERILRFYDLDSSALPDRLRKLIDPTGVLNNAQLGALGHIMTTDSFDLPGPGVLAPSEVRTNLNFASSSASQTILDLLSTRVAAEYMIVNNLTPPLSPAQQGQVSSAVTTFMQPTVLQALLPNEVLAGSRMDINRPFGNGRDDNNNGVVDDPIEALSEKIWFANNPTVPAALATYFSGVPFDAENFGSSGGNREQGSRAFYAKHLYVLMLLLINPMTLNNGIDWDNNGTIDLNETQRGLAQWAINVADFKDRDSIMSPFPYTIDPFISGWKVGPFPQATPPAGTDIVWGCERPELLITETLAFHDRRTEDLASESPVQNPVPGTEDTQGFTTDSAPKKDSDFDQRLLPLGSFFVELYNPWTTQSSTINPDGTPNTNGYPSLVDAPGDFYDVANNNVQGVQLSRRSRDASGNVSPTGSPIWRLLVVKRPGLPPPQGLPFGERKDPDDPNTPLIANSPQQPFDDVERSIYFVDPTTATPAITGHGQPYFSSKVVDPLVPGRYAVVGSAGYLDPVNTTPQRYVTPIGRTTTLPPGGQGQDYSTYRQIALTPGQGPTVNQVQILNNAGNEPAAVDIQPVVAAVIDSPRSVSISEPTGALAADPLYTTFGATTPVGTAEVAFNNVIDIPLDIQRGNNAALNGDFAAMSQNGTTVNFRTIHLQRLANPMAPWDPLVNPYRTIDTMTVDLTVFNGTWDPAKPKGAKDPTGANVGLASLQRGDPNPADMNPGIAQRNLWHHQVPNAAAPTTGAAQPTQFFASFFSHSLGYLNKFASTPGTTSNAIQNAYSSANPPSQNYVGAPNGGIGGQPFDWLTWNNRPFASPVELMLVPKSRSSRLLYDYTNTDPRVGVPTVTPPVPPMYTALSPTASPTAIAVYGHLMPFFASAATGGATPPNFHRLFEYVQTPSRFVGTETELNATSFTGVLANETNMLSFYHPPFNTVSNYRDPGKININTIPSDTYAAASSRVWNGLLNGMPAGLVPQWNQIVASRRGGFLSANGYELGLDSTTTPTFVSYFSSPFRSAAGAALTLPGMAGPTNEVSATLFRQVATTGMPLFNYAISGNKFDDSARNPYFRNQVLQKLANSITTRSNVYAVWITVGYFEVTPTAVNSFYPDGYQLGQEVGSDSGEIKRHRAFYIYDRSIPVGFEPGKDHNFDRGILLKRFIE